MKKILSMLIVLTMLLSASAMAVEMGVQVIGVPILEMQTFSLEDMKVDVTAKIDGYGELTPTKFKYEEDFSVCYEGKAGWDWDRNESGADADYAVLYMDILNDNFIAKSFLEECSVKVVFDDAHEFAGWFYQFDWNSGEYGDVVAINPVDNFPIEPMYAGHYCFGCTLPNAVVESDKPLRMEITLDGNEITYNIRK